MFRYDANTGDEPKIGDFVVTVRSGANSDGIKGKIGGWTGPGNMIALVALDKPLADGSTIVTWPVVCLQKAVVQHFKEVMNRHDIQREPADEDGYDLFDLYAEMSWNIANSHNDLTDSDGFIIWNGGAKRPVADDTRIQVKLRDGTKSDVRDAKYWYQICWTHHPDEYMSKWDIIGYKVVK